MLQIANACALPLRTVLFGLLVAIIFVKDTRLLIITGVLVVLYTIKRVKK